MRFVRTGEPNGAGAPVWAPVTKTTSPYMDFDAQLHTAQPSEVENKIEAAAVALAEKAWDGSAPPPPSVRK